MPAATLEAKAENFLDLYAGGHVVSRPPVRSLIHQLRATADNDNVELHVLADRLENLSS